MRISFLFLAIGFCALACSNREIVDPFFYDPVKADDVIAEVNGLSFQVMVELEDARAFVLPPVPLRRYTVSDVEAAASKVSNCMATMEIDELSAADDLRRINLADLRPKAHWPYPSFPTWPVTLQC